METVLVTGGAGSMGRLVVNQLISKNYLVKVFDLPQANFEGFDGSKTESLSLDIALCLPLIKFLILFIFFLLIN